MQVVQENGAGSHHAKILDQIASLVVALRMEEYPRTETRSAAMGLTHCVRPMSPRRPSSGWTIGPGVPEVLASEDPDPCPEAFHLVQLVHCAREAMRLEHIADLQQRAYSPGQLVPAMWVLPPQASSQ